VSDDGRAGHGPNAEGFGPVAGRVGEPGGWSDASIGEAERILRAEAGPRVRVAFPLAAMTSFRIGGPAALFLDAQTDADLAAAGAALTATGLPWIVLGKGSNVLVADGGFPGLVLRLGRGFRWTSRDGDRLHAGGAMPLPALAGVALSHALAGLEFGIAIPASVGGAVRMNAGAHGRSMSDVVSTVDLFSLDRGARSIVSAREAGFAYRKSHFPRGTLVVGVTVALAPGDPASIRGHMDDARAWRRATQPVAEPNCGSVFKNPPGEHAARLVEDSGSKGMSVGGAMVSRKHANFIVAGPGSTAADVLALIMEVRRRVSERFGIVLETEVKLVGDFDGAVA
jgi:UDP-N-acetylmuramate dehydrogenase